MKKIVVFTIELYQKIVSTTLHNVLGVSQTCRFHPTCSDYAKESISKEGILKGSAMSAVRLLKCQPFYNKNI